jgi:hypothetical protein
VSGVSDVLVCLVCWCGSVSGVLVRLVCWSKVNLLNLIKKSKTNRNEKEGKELR